MIELTDLQWTDIDTLVTLEKQLFEQDAWSAATWWNELAARPQRVYRIARDDDAIVGYAGLSVAGDVADVMTIGVDPKARGQGVGQLLLRELLSLAGQARVDAVLLEVRADNGPARRLYGRHGFEQISIRRRYYQPGDIDAYVLRRLLRDDQPDHADHADHEVTDVD